MRHLVGQRGIVGFSIAERFKRGHLHPVFGHRVESLIAAMLNGCAGRGKEGFSALDAGNSIEGRGLQGVEVRGQPFDLLGVENGVALHKGNIPLVVLAGRLVGFGAGDGVRIDDKRTLLALADLSAQLLRLFVGQP